MEMVIDPILAFICIPLVCIVPVVFIVLLYRRSGRSKSDDLDASVPRSELAEQTPTATPASKKPSTARRFLIFSFISLILLPCNFIFTLGAGMSGDFGESITILIIIIFYVHLAVTLISAAIGIVSWGISALEAYADSQKQEEEE